MLDDPGCLRALLEAAGQADRLVLLGDVIELRQRPLRDALAAATPVLEAIGGALRARAGVVVLAGNHDHRLVSPWLQRRDRAVPLTASGLIKARPGDPLAEVLTRLGRPHGPVASYPGVALRDGVWAHHGHYADRHTTVPILERLGAGVMARVVGRRSGVGSGADAPRTVEDYEAELAPIYAWIDALAENTVAGSERDLEGSEAAWLALSSPQGLRGRALAAGFPLLIAGFNRLGLGPLRSDLSGAALRRGALTAMGEVQARLGVSADWIVFGHTHRAGPLPEDDLAEWRTPAGTRLLNTGSWVREGALLRGDPKRSPYRAGFAAWVDSDPAIAPELVNLLD